MIARLFALLRREPVRAYLWTVAVAAGALLAVVSPSLPLAAILGLVSAILAVPAGGEVFVRRNVSPAAHVVVHKNDLHPIEELGPPDGAR